MKTLITGAPGWLGNQLVSVLVDQSNELYRFSVDGTRKVRCLILPGLDTAMLPDSVEKIPGNICEYASLVHAMEGIETVFHLVGIIHPKKISDLYLVNRDGLRNVLQASVSAGVRRVIVVSSNSPAGTNTDRNVLMKENDAPRPYMNYGRSKYEAEQIALEYARSNKIEVVILRPCWFYGPGQPERQTRFFSMIKSGSPLMFGDGKNLRSMSYIDNTIQGLLLAEKCPGISGRIYWITDERPYSTLEIYQTIADILDVKMTPRNLPNLVSWGCEAADRALQAMGMYNQEIHVAGEMVKDISCSIARAQEELGYRPTISLQEGMRRSIEWCRRRGDAI